MMPSNKNLYSDMAEVADLPLRKKVSATVWAAIFCMAGAFGLTAGAGLVIAICDAIPVLIKHWFG